MTEDVVRLFFVLVPLSKNKINLKGRTFARFLYFYAVLGMADAVKIL